MACEILQSERGKNKIVADGYIYVKQKALANNIVSFECERRRGNGKGLSECKAKIKVDAAGVIVGRVNDHTHAPDAARVEMLNVRASIKRRAEQTLEAPQQILNEELQTLSQEAAVQMAPVRHVRRCIRRTRNHAIAVHPIPTDRSFVIPDEFKRLANGD
jgi:hypothetical protein